MNNLQNIAMIGQKHIILSVVIFYGNGRFATFTYDAWNNLEKTYCNNGHTKTYGYDKLRRLITEIADGYKKRYIYAGNQISSILHYTLTGDTIIENYVYANGHATSLGLGTGECVWQLQATNSRGLSTAFRQGCLNDTLSYDLRGNVTSRKVNYAGNLPVQHQQYSYSTATGNMTWQQDNVNGYIYDYSYDGMNRLTDDNRHEYSYNALGSMVGNDAAGMMTYGSNAPYAMSFLTPASGSAVPQRDQSITFNSMQLPDTIAEGSCTAAFEYYGDMTRAIMAVANTAGHSETRHYYGNDYVVMLQMRDDVQFSKHVLWLGGTSYDAPAALVKDYNSNRWQLLHIVRDNLGSITQLVDTLGNVVQEVGYSSWGLLRDPEMDTLYRYDNQPELLLGYGYTGHEHLPWFGLINMNARLYDPATGRFLNPDPVVQLPDNTQSYNRYSYCLNNPLRYTDPTGLESWFTNDPQEIGLLLNEIKNGGIDWTTEMFVNYARNRYETSSGWSYNPYVTFTMSSSGRLFYTQCSVVNGNVTVFGCFVGYGASRSTLLSEADHGPYSNSGSETKSDSKYSVRDYSAILVNALSAEPTIVRSTIDLLVLDEVGASPKLSQPKTWLKSPSADEYDKVLGKDVAKYAKASKIASNCFTSADILITLSYAYDDYNNGKIASALARCVVGGATIGVGLIPYIGP